MDKESHFQLALIISKLLSKILSLSRDDEIFFIPELPIFYQTIFTRAVAVNTTSYRDGYNGSLSIFQETDNFYSISRDKE